MKDELFFDTDCLSAFLWIHDTNLIESLYGGRIVIPGPVYQELSNPCVPHIKKRTDALITREVASVRELYMNTQEYDLYRILIKGDPEHIAIGRGEASGIALAKTYQGILASNNWRDIGFYLEKYNLRHIDTGMILTEGLNQGLITLAQGEEIWKNMRSKNRRLPADTFSQYLSSRS